MRSSALVVVLALAFAFCAPGAKAETCNLDTFDWASYSASISGCVTAYQSSFSTCGQTISCYCDGFADYSSCVLNSANFCVAESWRSALKSAQDSLAQYCTFANSLFTYTFTFRISNVVGFQTISPAQKTQICVLLVTKMGSNINEATAICDAANAFELTFTAVESPTRRDVAMNVVISAVVKIEDTLPPSLGDFDGSPISFPYTTTSGSSDTADATMDPSVAASESAASSASSPVLSALALIATLAGVLLF